MKEDGVDVDVKFQGDSLVHMGRDAISDYAIGNKYSHVLWLDADMVFDDDIYSKLSSTGKDFVSGIAHGRRPPHRSCLFKQLGPKVIRYENEYPSELFEVAACGFGCVFIKVDILKEVKKRHFYSFLPTMDLGEDLAFCKRATDLGYRIYAHPGVVLGHMSHKPIYPEDYMGE